MAYSSLVREVQGDLARHGGSFVRNPALWALTTYRFGRYVNTLPEGRVRRLGSKLYGALFLGVELATGITIHREARVGSGFHLVHNGNIKIHPGVVIGDRCGVMHDVTIGSNMERAGVPIIGDDVFIGAGAKVLGPITIGDGARIAANSLVISDVPAGATAVGVPARNMQYTGRAALRPAPEVVVAAAAPAALPTLDAPLAELPLPLEAQAVAVARPVL